uniref:Uncharacterized protein n=1 Tax=Siphoviridae sp. ctLnP14 TaxID=2827851 RepID=A0A8S5S8R2_9CAUD|nr:MAG TPA: hypothetical protein [Siphoviridae sp. ctLnP14]
MTSFCKNSKRYQKEFTSHKIHARLTIDII